MSIETRHDRHPTIIVFVPKWDARVAKNFIEFILKNSHSKIPFSI
jgi:hypothetical protein